MSDGDAEEAFDHLRGEVALLRRAIEGLLADPVKIPPEVSRQLRAQSAELKRLAEETQRLAVSPALDVTPGVYSELIRRASNTTTERFEAPWNKTLADLQKVGAEFARYGERARNQELQRRQIAGAAFAGAVIAIVAWLGLSGPIARAFPERWQVAERLAAATLDLDRLSAGQRLIARADPEGWRALERALELVDKNEEAVARCTRGRPIPQKPLACSLVLPESWLRRPS